MSIASIILVGSFFIGATSLAYLFVRWLDRVLPMPDDD